MNFINIIRAICKFYTQQTSFIDCLQFVQLGKSRNVGAFFLTYSIRLLRFTVHMGVIYAGFIALHLS